MAIRFTNRWAEFSIEELKRMLWMTEYYVNQDDLTFDLGKEIETELRRREKIKKANRGIVEAWIWAGGDGNRNKEQRKGSESE